MYTRACLVAVHYISRVNTPIPYYGGAGELAWWPFADRVLGVVMKMHHAFCVALVSPLACPTAPITRCFKLEVEGFSSHARKWPCTANSNHATPNL